MVAERTQSRTQPGVGVNPELMYRSIRTDTYRFDCALLVVLFATTVDAFNFLDRGGPLRYLLLLPPFASILFLRLRWPTMVIRRPSFSDCILLVLLAFGLCGTAYGVIFRGTANSARPIFLPMIIAPLYLATMEDPTDEEAFRLLRAIAWIGSLYVCLNAFVNSGLVGRLLAYQQYRNASLAIAALGIGATIVLKKWVRLGLLLLLAGYVFSTYPSATTLLVAISTILTLFVTRRPGTAILRIYVVTLFSLAVIALAFLNFNKTVAFTNDYFSLVNKANADVGRLALWSSGIERFKESPFIGAGFAGPSVSAAVQNKELPFHNDYVLFLAEGGILGFGLLLAWIVATEFTLVRRHAALAGAGRYARAALVRAVLVGLNAFFVAAAVNPVFPGASRAATIFALYALAMGVSTPRQPAPRQPSPAVTRGRSSYEALNQAGRSV